MLEGAAKPDNYGLLIAFISVAKSQLSTTHTNTTKHMMRCQQYASFTTGNLFVVELMFFDPYLSMMNHTQYHRRDVLWSRILLAKVFKGYQKRGSVRGSGTFIKVCRFLLVLLSWLTHNIGAFYQCILSFY